MALHHDSVTPDLTFAARDRLILSDRNFTRYRLDHLQQLFADRAVVPGLDGAGVNLINEATLRIRCYYYARRMRISRNGFVLEIDPVGRDKNEDKNQRDHDVVMQRATLVRPEDVATNCAPDGGHRQGRRVGRGRRRYVSSLQV